MMSHLKKMGLAAVAWTAVGAAADARAVVITLPTSDIVGVSRDPTTGKSGVSTDYPDAESPAKAIDGLLSTKYLNFVGAGLDDNGKPAASPTGFIVTLTGPAPIDGFRFGVANDAPSRDPATVRIEGTNRAGGSAFLAANDDGTDWTPVYSGPTGIAADAPRLSYGSPISFAPSAAYTSYRVTITDLIRVPDNAPTFSQFAEVELTNSGVPEPTSLGLLGVGCVGLLTRRHRRR